MSNPTESTFKVPLTRITAIQDHPNADRLELAMVYAFQVVVKKGSYQVGDQVLYIPIDSIIDTKLEDHLFPEDAKITLSKQRVRQIRIRKCASQGMLVSPDDIATVFGLTPNKLEKDYQTEINVTKYEPPTPEYQQGQKKKVKKLENPYFDKYGGLTNIKWSPYLFKKGDLVVYQEKIHGSCARASVSKFATNTIWKKIKCFFGLTPKVEFCYGSNNVQLQERSGYKGYYGEDIYGKVFSNLDTESKLKDGEAIYGELYGEGVQKNYNYGLKGEHKFILFDVKITNGEGVSIWLNPDEVIVFGKERGFDVVPELYRGEFIDMNHVKAFTLGPSVLCKKQQVREGLVVKSLDNYSDVQGSKRALKCISEKYLDKDQSDFH